MTDPHDTSLWNPESWRVRTAIDPAAKLFAAPYDDEARVADATGRLRELPPLVTSFEIESLKKQLAEAAEGKRFLLWGGDCAETLADCRPAIITIKLKILLQMSLVLVYAAKKPVVRVGRMCGQYAKPRSSATETRTIDGQSVTLPSYFGDLINRADFTPESRRPDPELMLEGYKHAALTLNFVRSLLHAGFADIHHPEYWDLGFLQRAALTPDVRREYELLTSRLLDGVRFMEAVGERGFEQLSAVEFFSSHEALNLFYESAQTRTVPRRTGHYNLSTHLPWLGERTRRLDGPHVEYLRGINNPIGIKLGPSANIDDILRLLDTLDPAHQPGKLVLIPRLGAANVRRVLPGFIEGVRRSGRSPLWVCDPMHANALNTRSGRKTRSFDDILRELDDSVTVHTECNSRLGGVHLEITGQDVTECIGGAMNLSEDDLDRNYDTLCDPRLNYEQSLELAFRLARRLAPA
ncbi:MAG: 3-deoxy-7-phosphoheptulonate synthase [Phycisphaerales bacterium]|nr:3-deoxy-7-phosphoheptulonate synthase [Phycisphaerales bacterium]